MKHLNKDLLQELQYVKEMIENNPKNYQVWYVRTCVCLYVCVLNCSDMSVTAFAT